MIRCLEFFDVKFYPYGAPDHDPIFAAVSKKHVSMLSLVVKNSSRCMLLMMLMISDHRL